MRSAITALMKAPSDTEGNKHATEVRCGGNGLGNCLATGNGSTTCLPRYPLKVSVCVLLLHIEYHNTQSTGKVRTLLQSGAILAGPYNFKEVFQD